MSRIKFIDSSPSPRGPAPQSGKPPPRPAKPVKQSSEGRAGLLAPLLALAIVVALSLGYLLMGLGSSADAQLDYDSKLVSRYTEYVRSCRSERSADCRAFADALPDSSAVASRVNLIVFYRNVGDKVRAEKETSSLLLSMPYDARNPLFAALAKGQRR